MASNAVERKIVHTSKKSNRGNSCKYPARASWSQFQELDHSLSRLMSLYNGYFGTKSFKILRALLKFLEWTGHGVPWLVFASYKIFASSDQFYFTLMLSLILDLIVIAVLKLVFQRPRPIYNENDMPLSASKVDDFSFPSGHTTRAFMVMLLYVMHKISNIERISWISWAVLLGLSRVVLGRHHLSDVVAGVFIGLADGVVVTEFVMWYNRQHL